MDEKPYIIEKFETEIGEYLNDDWNNLTPLEKSRYLTGFMGSYHQNFKTYLIEKIEGMKTKCPSMKNMQIEQIIRIIKKG